MVKNTHLVRCFGAWQKYRHHPTPGASPLGGKTTSAVFTRVENEVLVMSLAGTCSRHGAACLSRPGAQTLNPFRTQSWILAKFKPHFLINTGQVCTNGRWALFQQHFETRPSCGLFMHVKRVVHFFYAFFGPVAWLLAREQATH